MCQSKWGIIRVDYHWSEIPGPDTFKILKRLFFRFQVIFIDFTDLVFLTKNSRKPNHPKSDSFWCILE